MYNVWELSYNDSQGENCTKPRGLYTSIAHRSDGSQDSQMGD
jgi:hypothetical protein